MKRTIQTRVSDSIPFSRIFKPMLVVCIWFSGAVVFGKTTFHEEAKFSSPTGYYRNGFGRAVDILGDRAIVGAIGANSGSGPFDAAYVFKRDDQGWRFDQQLVPSNVQASTATYGISVAIDDSQAIVGADLNGEIQWQSGAVYVFDRGPMGYTEVQKIFHPELIYDGNFGRSISLDGNTMLVGAPGLSGGSPPPTAYAFVKQAGIWTLQAKLIPTIAPGTLERYGTSVAIDGDFAVVGDDGGFSQGFNNRGDARIFKRTGTSWNETQLLSAFDSGTNQTYGEAVSISGDTIAIGAPGGGDHNNLSGSIYIYRLNGSTWQLEQKLKASDQRGGDSFGRHLSLDGNLLVVGHQENSGATSSGGAVHVFERIGTTWQQTARLFSSDGMADDYFGSSISLDGRQFIAGASSADPFGAAYVFVPEPSSMLLTALCICGLLIDIRRRPPMLRTISTDTACPCFRRVLPSNPSV